MSERPRDELVVHLFFSSIYSSLYFYALSTVLRTSSFTTVAQFYSVLIEDLSQFVTSWELFVNEVDERSSYIC